MARSARRIDGTRTARQLVTGHASSPARSAVIPAGPFTPAAVERACTLVVIAYVRALCDAVVLAYWRRTSPIASAAPDLGARVTSDTTAFPERIRGAGCLL
jgi:hypothetical protein